MIFLLLSISALIIGGSGDQSSCLYNLNELNSLDNYHIESVLQGYNATQQLDCSNFNARNFTYTLKAFHNGTIKDLDSFGCSSGNSYYYKAKGDPSRTTFVDPKEVSVFCAVPINRTCENPTKCEECRCEDSQCGTICKEARLICPTYTEGTDAEAAKLECRIWFIHETEGKYHRLRTTPTCRLKPGENSPAFYLLLPSGEERAISSRDSCLNHARNGGGVSVPYIELFSVDTIFAIFGGLSVAAVCGLIVVVICWCKFKKNSSRRTTHQMSAVVPGSEMPVSD